MLLLSTVACQKAEPPAAAPAAQEVAAAPVQPGSEQVLGRIHVPEVPLVDQDGKPVHLQKDFIQDRVVVMNFVFTRCTTICPPLGVGFSRLQALLGEQVGKQVQLVSVSLDPTYDTPEVLRAWGDKFGRGPGWTLMTGAKEDVDTVLKALKVYTAAKEQHAPIVLVGNGVSGEWVRVHGLASPVRLKAVVDRVLAQGAGNPQVVER